jgi:sugar O-acyltransferase (sialic acid O-acetyltransferase NeuD family)
MSKTIIIVGAGGFGREVFWLISEINSHNHEWDVLGFLDDNKNALAGFENYPEIIGIIDDYREINNKYNDSVFLINAIGDPDIKKKVVMLLNDAGAKWATLVHPTSSIGTNSTINEGSILARNSLITCDVTVGRHVHINCYSGCGHDVIVGDYCTMAAHVDIQGGVHVGEGVFFWRSCCCLAKSKSWRLG